MSEPLHGKIQKAIRQGDLSTLARICATSPKATAMLLSRDTLGNSPIHFAAAQGHVDIVKLIIKLGADADKENEYGWTPLMLASFYGHLPLCQFLLALKSVNPDKRNALGLTSLKCSVYGFHAPITTLLLEHGVDVNHGGSHGQGLTALMIACRVKNHNAVTALLQNGADCNYQSRSNGWTSLFYAVHPDDYSLVKILLNARAEPKLQDWSGRTAIGIAEDLGCDIEALFGNDLDNDHASVMLSGLNVSGAISPRGSADFSSEESSQISRTTFKRPTFNFQSMEAPESNDKNSAASPIARFSHIKNPSQDGKISGSALPGSHKDGTRGTRIQQESLEDPPRSARIRQESILDASRSSRTMRQNSIDDAPRSIRVQRQDSAEEGVLSGFRSNASSQSDLPKRNTEKDGLGASRKSSWWSTLGKSSSKQPSDSKSTDK